MCIVRTLFACLFVFVFGYVSSYEVQDAAPGWKIIKDYKARCTNCHALMSRNKRLMTAHARNCFPADQLYVFLRKFTLFYVNLCYFVFIYVNLC